MTSQPEDADRVEFVIKSYPDHDGVTEQIAGMQPGDRVLAEEPAGAITDHGAGVFIAGGAGVTPFIPILRRRAREDTLSGCRLVYSNATEADIILREEWEGMDGLDTVWTITDQEDTDLPKTKVDKAFLQKVLTDTAQPFYICGPKAMVNDVRDALTEIGVAKDNIITEKGW